ncbi:putative transcriptional regulator, TetR family [Rhodospirillaceae bacterium LM-1]|nr:putative transcriptional regulator, TetR family [Rhodospirillaceae bacterium LM-1]
MAAATGKSEKTSSGKRALIQAAASRLFLSQGYAKASMDAIASEAGVSKATLYAHFKSKQALFESMVQERFRQEMEESLQPALLGDDPLEGLAAIGRRFLGLLLKPGALSTFRLVLSEGRHLPELSEAFYRSGPARTLSMVAAYIEYLNKLGRLQVPDPVLGADLFLGSLRNSSYLKCLLGMEPAPEASEIAHVAHAAASQFVAGHRPGNPNS